MELGTFVVGIIIGGAGVYYVMRTRSRGDNSDESFDGAQDRLAECQKELERTRKELEEEEKDIKEADDLSEFNEKQSSKKTERKEQVMALFETQEEVRNDDVTDKLEVSRATAYNYLEELENEGKIEQVGKAGRAVV